MRLLLMLTALWAAGSYAQSDNEQIRIRRRNRITDDGGKKVVCYYTNWSVYRQGLAKYTPQNINPYLCTHLIYAFGGLTDDFEVVPFDSYQDIEKGGYAQFNGLKQYNRGMKTLLAVGGWNEGSARFSELVSFPEYRKNFTDSAIKHLRRYNFDGLDLDWEYPGSRQGSTADDKRNYALLVKELREAFEAEGTKISKGRLLLTMAVPAGKKYLDKGYDIPSLNQNLDFFNILSYDYHSVLEPTVNHHAALLPKPGLSEFDLESPLNVDWTVKYYLKKGATRDKLVIGIPTYGRSYTLLDGQFNSLGASADGAGAKGNYTKEKGYLSFYEICEAISVDGWQVRKPYPKRMGPFAFKGDQWVGYDDEKMVGRKAKYVLDEKLGGIMFWTVDSDDFRGLCKGEKYPLIEAAKRALFVGSENEAKAASQRDIKPDSPPQRIRGGSKRRPRPRPLIINPWVTPEPPTTPTTVKGFKCKREGFYPNPDDCHMYYWCLDSGDLGQGIVAHTFTCPSDLVFSRTIDGCDHPSRAKCETAPKRGEVAAPTTTPIPTTTEFDYTNVDDYYYYYDEYEYYDYEADKKFNEEAISQDIPAPVPAKEVSSQRVPERPAIELGGRDRPQYSTIQRDRSRVPESPQQVEDTPTRQRPEYVTLNRQRPASPVAEEAVEDQSPQVPFDVATQRTLEYVTLDRRRPAAQEKTIDEIPLYDEVESPSTAASAQSPEREYVTIRRARPSTPSTPSTEEPSTTLPSIEPEISTDSLVILKQDPAPKKLPPVPKIKIPEIFLTRKVEPQEPPITRHRVIPQPVRIEPAEEVIPDEAPPQPKQEIEPEQEIKEDTRPAIRRPSLRTKSEGSRIDRPDPNFQSRRRQPVRQRTQQHQQTRIDSTRRRTRPETQKEEIPDESQRQRRPIDQQRERRPTTRTRPPQRQHPTRRLPSRPREDTRRRIPNLNRIAKPEEEKLVTPIPVEKPDEPVIKQVKTEVQQREPEKPPQDTIQRLIDDVMKQIEEKEAVVSPKEGAVELPPIFRTPEVEEEETSPPVADKVDSFDPFEFVLGEESLPQEPEVESSPSTTTTTTSSTTTTTTTSTTITSVIPETEPPTTRTTTTTTEAPTTTTTQSTTTSTKPTKTEDSRKDSTMIPAEEASGRELPTRPPPRRRPTPLRRIPSPIAEEDPHQILQKTEETEPSPTASAPRPRPPQETGQHRGLRPFSRTPHQPTPEARPPLPPPPPTRPRVRTLPPTPATTRPIQTPPSRGTPRPRVTIPARTPSPPVDYEYAYDYYDEAGALGGSLGRLATLNQQKAVLRADGRAQCFDTGYFPHPFSCKKFISCSKTVSGVLRGWIYTCPQDLVFDPVGGMCNWAEAVDCLQA